jgi:hypothetical protein
MIQQRPKVNAEGLPDHARGLLKDLRRVRLNITESTASVAGRFELDGVDCTQEVTTLLADGTIRKSLEGKLVRR